MNQEIKQLEKELQISTLEILISLAEYRERTYEVKKLNQIKQFIDSYFSYGQVVLRLKKNFFNINLI